MTKTRAPRECRLLERDARGNTNVRHSKAPSLILSQGRPFPRALCLFLTAIHTRVKILFEYQKCDKLLYSCTRQAHVRKRDNHEMFSFFSHAGGSAMGQQVDWHPCWPQRWYVSGRANLGWCISFTIRRTFFQVFFCRQKCQRARVGKKNSMQIDKE